jgi:hypothetical protein
MGLTYFATLSLAMPKGPKGPKGERRHVDVIGNAAKVMKIASGEEPEVLTSAAPDGAIAAIRGLDGLGRPRLSAAEQVRPGTQKF